MTNERWVSQVCKSVEGTKHEYTQYVHVLDGIMYGTDARRMHCTPTSFPDGVYTPLMLPVSCESKAPLMRDMHNKCAALRMDEWSKSCIVSQMKSGYNGVPHLHFRQAPNGPKINHEFLMQAVCDDPNATVFYCETEPNGGKVTGLCEHGEFVIKGIRA